MCAEGGCSQDVQGVRALCVRFHHFTEDRQGDQDVARLVVGVHVSKGEKGTRVGAAVFAGNQRESLFPIIVVGRKARLKVYRVKHFPSLPRHLQLSMRTTLRRRVLSWAVVTELTPKDRESLVALAVARALQRVQLQRSDMFGDRYDVSVLLMGEPLDPRKVGDLGEVVIPTLRSVPWQVQAAELLLSTGDEEEERPCQASPPIPDATPPPVSSVEEPSSQETESPSPTSS